MTDQHNTLREDIAFLRAVAEGGQRQPPRGGSLLMAGGLIFGTASLAIWLAQQSSGPKPWLGWVWPASGAVFMVALTVFLRSLPKRETPHPIGVAWSGLGWAIFTVVLSLMLIAWRTGAWQAAAAISPVILSLYGAGWMIAGLVSKARWLNVVGIAAFAAALLNAWTVADGKLMFLVYALSLYLLVALPGFVLMRQARAARTA